jgi:hypothetical protein
MDDINDVDQQNNGDVSVAPQSPTTKNDNDESVSKDDGVVDVTDESAPAGDADNDAVTMEADAVPMEGDAEGDNESDRRDRIDVDGDEDDDKEEGLRRHSSTTRGAARPARGSRADRDAPYSKNEGSSGGARNCDNCGVPGHFARECPEDPKCFACGKTGHAKAACPEAGKTCGACGRRGHIESMCRYPNGGGPPPSHHGARTSGRCNNCNGVSQLYDCIPSV